VRYPSYGPAPTQPPTPRLIFGTDSAQVEVWCISDLLSKFPNTAAYQSSSERKMDVLGQVFDYSPLPIGMVVAAGTASSGPFCPPYNNQAQCNINGSIVIGSQVFLHDGHPDGDRNSDSRWNRDCFDKLMKSSLSSAAIVEHTRLGNLEPALLCPPTNPAPNGQHIYIDANYVAIADINVTDYREYATKDKEAGASFVANCPGNPNGVSLETTHGLIYVAARDALKNDPPFFFISGVVDRFTMYDIDVTPRKYAQNVTGAHNAGVVVAQLVANLL
jgi:hypothetical protein